MATPLSWNSCIFCPSLMGRSTVKRRFCLVEFKYTGSMILAVSDTKRGNSRTCYSYACFYLHSVFLIHLSLVRWRLVEISLEMASMLFLHTAPDSFNPSTAKLQSSKLGLSASSETETSRWSSSSDQELAWATHCLVAVMKASGLNKPDVVDRLSKMQY